jgi:pilus assembly protein CpaE
MNAPFKPSSAGLREPFAAYMCDDDSLDTLRHVVAELGWLPEKCNKGGLRNAVQSLSISASPNILFVDLSESGDPLNDINGLAEVCEPGTVVIAAGMVNDVRLYRDLLGSGIQDYILKPLVPDQLRDAFSQAQAMMNAPKVVDHSADQPHIVSFVIGARGGVGASTIATSLAWMISTQNDRNTSLLDLDVHFGTGALALDLEPGRGLTDAIDNPSRIDGLFIERAMVRAGDKLSILSAEAPIHQPMMSDGAAFFQLQEELRNAFENTIVDLPRHMLVQHPHLLHEAASAIVVTELTLAAARDTIRLLAWFKANAPQTQVSIVANKMQPGVGEISRKDFEESIERSLDFVLPYDQKLAAQAAKLGKTLGEVARTQKLGQQLQAIVSRVLAQSDEDAVAPSAGKGKKTVAGKSSGSLLSKMNFASFLPKKAAKKEG